MKNITLSAVTVNRAIGLLTSTGVNVTAANDVTIGDNVYIFRAALTGATGEVLIGADAAATLANLKAAVNYTGSPNVQYKVSAAHPDVRAGAITATTLAFQTMASGVAGNSIVTLESAVTLSWGAANLTGGSDAITFSGTVADVTATRQAQQVTIAQYPSQNPNFSRGIQISTEYVMVKRNGGSPAAIDMDSLALLGTALEPSLSFAPLITTQPSDATVAFARQVLTSNNTNVSNNDPVVIGIKTYTFKTALTPTEGEVLIGADADASLLNLIRAINHTGTPNTDYKCAAANTQVRALATVTAHALTIIALVPGTSGNAIGTTETAATLTWGAVTMAGGVGSSVTEFEVVAASELTGTTYQWQVSTDGTTWTDLTNAGIYGDVTTATMTITPTTTGQNGYQYRCVVTNSAGNTDSTAETLTIT